MTKHSTNHTDSVTQSPIGIIGYGRFGALLCALLAADLPVVVYDPGASQAADQPQLPEGARWGSEEEVVQLRTIWYAVPINAFEDVLESHAQVWKKTGSFPDTIGEVCSVKLHPQAVCQKLLPPETNLLLTHPMFGPDSCSGPESITGKCWMIDPSGCNDAEVLECWRGWFAAKSIDLIEMSCDEHDRLAANSQGVTHFVGRALAESGFEPTSIDTAGAKALQQIVTHTCNDSWELFRDLQHYNPYTTQMRLEVGSGFDEVYRALLPNRVHKETLVVGIQGGPGSFNEEAARYYCERNGIEVFSLRYLYTTEAVLDALHRGEVDRGQFAIHNSIGGIVQETVTAVAQHRFSIVEQFSILIEHCLMRHESAALSDITAIITHPQVLKQCKTSLAQKYPRLSQKSGSGDLIDSATVAKAVSEGELDATTAVMGSRAIADLYTNLVVVECGLQDQKDNYTSFLWVEREQPIQVNR